MLKIETRKWTGETQFLVVKKSKEHIDAALRLFIINDGDFKVAFMPALNLSGYGKTNTEAISMLNEVLEDYFARLLKLKQDALNHELSKYGWKLVSLSKRFENTAHVDKEGVLRNFKLPEDTPIEERMVSMAA